MRLEAKADFRDRTSDGRRHQGITPLERYFVIEVDDEDYRVIDDFGEPILYPKSLFEVLDSSIPSGWHLEEYGDGEYHLGPPETLVRGFYERFFCSQGDHAAADQAEKTLRHILEVTRRSADDEDRRLITRDLERLQSPRHRR